MKKIIFSICAICIILFSSCSEGMNDAAGGDSSTGQGGSMARFTIKDNTLYVVDRETLKLFDVTTASTPKYLTMKDQFLGFDVETIFVMDSTLFIGSETGMFMYDISRPEFPARLAEVSHIRSCDPVVASGNYAYVTLNTLSARCGGGENVLRIYDISQRTNPKEVKTIALNTPRGLGVDGNKLFICVNKGIIVYDITDPENPVWVDDLSHISEAQNIDAYDVIPVNGVLIMTGADGIYQFDYTGERLQFLSKIAVKL